MMNNYLVTILQDDLVKSKCVVSAKTYTQAEDKAFDFADLLLGLKDNKDKERVSILVEIYNSIEGI